MPIYMSPAEGQGLANWTRGLPPGLPEWLAGGCFYCCHLMTTAHVGAKKYQWPEEGQGQDLPLNFLHGPGEQEGLQKQADSSHLAGGVSSFPSRAFSKRNPQLRWFPWRRASTSSTATFFGVPFAYPHRSLNPPSSSLNPQNTD